MNSIGLNMDALLISNYIKYDELVPIINNAYMHSESNMIDVYIDINSLTKSLFGDNDIIIQDYIGYSAALINMCTHYRHFFISRYKTYSRFYLVYSENTPWLNSRLIEGYNSNYKKSLSSKNKAHVIEMVNKNLEILNILCPYLEDIYFITSGFETGVAIYDLMCRQDLENKNAHMIISKDRYNYQLVNMKPQTIILRPKSNRQSYFVDKNNIYKTYSAEKKLKSDISPIIAPELYTAILALNGFKDRNINSFIDIRKTNKLLENAISNRYLLNTYNEPNNIYAAISEPTWRMCQEEFVNRFKALDIQFQHSVFINTQEPEVISKNLINLNNPTEVQHINNVHFKSRPLDLNRI